MIYLILILIPGADNVNLTPLRHLKRHQKEMSRDIGAEKRSTARRIYIAYFLARFSATGANGWRRKNRREDRPNEARKQQEYLLIAWKDMKSNFSLSDNLRLISPIHWRIPPLDSGTSDLILTSSGIYVALTFDLVLKLDRLTFNPD